MTSPTTSCRAEYVVRLRSAIKRLQAYSSRCRPHLGRLNASDSTFLVEEVILKHGAPKVILTDRGREFVNQTFDTIAQLYGSTHQTTTAYHLRTNGLTERFNGTLAKMIACYTKNHRDWDRFLPFLVFAYNTSDHDVTGYSPYFLLHGFEP